MSEVEVVNASVEKTGRIALTQRLENVMEQIKSYMQAKGYAPSIRDLAEINNVSHSAVAVWLNVLEKNGRIVRSKRTPRSITIA